MDSDSLIKVQEKIADLLNNVDIDAIDKVELLINLVTFLDPDYYDKSIKILKKELYQDNKQNYSKD